MGKVILGKNMEENPPKVELQHIPKITEIDCVYRWIYLSKFIITEKLSGV